MLRWSIWPQISSGAVSMDRMSEVEVNQAIQARPDWSETGGAINRTYQFANFIDAMEFVNAVAQLAEADQHHPDILVRWNKVTLSLSTHDAAGITMKDFEMAAKADLLSTKLKEGTPAKQRASGSQPKIGRK